MTLNEIREYDRDYLTPTQVAGVLHVMPYTINIQAKKNPDSFGFPVVMVGTRVKIPRLPFIRYMTGE